MKKQEKSRHPEYYEAILQLRPITDKLIEFVKDELDRHGVRVTKVIEHKNGLDLYLDNQKFVRTALVSQLKRKFKGTITQSKALYGRHKQTQKLIYRSTVLFRLDDKKE